ncbi:hypothetical protein PC9H_005279 [Pleurotus ostreatus]|uniref:Uncharacterized protein n=1 Tax=Pleurotus ostreatus TaxID=5322 RepID=A0A8H7DU87_PLEOS|nr:uncharacterized protein PC9H_005279 [Pleurotus ostreatus]KAF7433329.1 hypothetical protein PC9H_005279 [Pleurotus ostreatus]
MPVPISHQISIPYRPPSRTTAVGLRTSEYYRYPISFTPTGPSVLANLMALAHQTNSIAPGPSPQSIGNRAKQGTAAGQNLAPRKRPATTPLQDAYNPMSDPAVVVVAARSQVPRKRICTTQTVTEPMHRATAAKRRTLPDTTAVSDISLWMSDFIFQRLVGISCRDASYEWNRDFFEVTNGAAKTIASSSWRRDLSSATLFLAMWYIERLFPEPILSLLGVDVYGMRLIIERVYILGAMLANKWLDEPCWKTLHWLYDSDMNSETLKRVDILGFRALGHNLSISNEQWRDWLTALVTHPSVDSARSLAASLTIRAQIRNVLSDLVAHHPAGFSLAKPTSPLPLGPLEDLHGVLRSGLRLASPPRPHFAPEWSPGDDPIVLPVTKTRRNDYGAIGRPVLASTRNDSASPASDEGGYWFPPPGLPHPARNHYDAHYPYISRGTG